MQLLVLLTKNTNNIQTKRYRTNKQVKKCVAKRLKLHKLITIPFILMLFSILNRKLINTTLYSKEWSS